MVDRCEHRRLAAILAADMVGYSRLMENDEWGTIARQRTHRSDLIDPTIDRHRGRIVKLMGDGMLVEFASVVDAVECAAAIQRGMHEREAGVAKDQRIQYRVGVNLGDIIVENEASWLMGSISLPACGRTPSRARFAFPAPRTTN